MQQHPPSLSTVPLSTWRKAVQERDEFATAAARLLALKQQLRPKAKQRDDLQVRLLAAERNTTITEAERDVALRNKGIKGMRK